MTSNAKPLPERRKNLRRGFIAAETAQASAALAEAFAARGMACVRADDIAPGPLTGELLQHLETADFMCASANDGSAAHVLFEIGIAHVLGKPVILFTTTYDWLFGRLRGIYVVKATIAELPSVSAEIDRFLEHAKPLRPIDDATRLRQRPNLSWAREEFEVLRRGESLDRALRFERLVAQVFRRVGAEVVEAGRSEKNVTADLIVTWLDDVATEIGGPIIIECKYTVQSRGRLVSAIDQIEKYIGASSAALGLVVYGYSQEISSPSVSDTPRVLVFQIDELIRALEDGTLSEQILQRRRRASYAKVTAGGPD
jgi:hypothetical protein